MLVSVLFSWLEKKDLVAAFEKAAEEFGPIASALQSGGYTRLVVLSNYDEERSRLYCSWIEVMFPKVVPRLYTTDLSSPDNYEEIYAACDKVVQQEQSPDTQLTFNLSCGTSAMSSIWILLASGKYRARLIKAHNESGYTELKLPSDLFAGYRPEKDQSGHISVIADSLLPKTPAFDLIIHSCKDMKRAIAKAKRAAVFEVPVLLLGESGSGKELFARAIHHASTRSSGPFIAVNCAALPESGAESAFFGHARGDEPGAGEKGSGYLEKAHGGTLYLENIGELALKLQYKLLQVLHDTMLKRVGERKLRDADVRIISSSNRNLVHDVASGIFSHDLFYKMSVGFIKIPPLRERGKDLPLLIKYICTGINREFSSSPGWQTKSLNEGALQAMYKHSWPGNVRELISALTRAFIFSGGDEIDETAIQDALIDLDTGSDGLLNRPLGRGFSIEDVLSQTAVHYLERAMKQTGGNKTRAAQLLGLSSYQTLTNWLERYGVKEK